MRGTLVLDTLLTTSAGAPGMKKKGRLSLTCWPGYLPKVKEVLGDLEELSSIDIGSLNSFIRSSECFRDLEIADN